MTKVIAKVIVKKMPNEKLQKVLARSGCGSRRQIEAWIKTGRIRINDKIAKIGDRITLRDKVYLDSKEVKLIAASCLETRVLIYNKPIGEVSTRSDEKGRANVFSRLPKLSKGRWIIIGRLDLNSSGLLLFTDDGDLANALMHPKHEIEREYLARVFGEVDALVLDELHKGVVLDDGIACFKSIKPVGKQVGMNRWYKVVVTEGRNRIVRRLWNAKNIVVNSLIRIRFCDILLPRLLDPGHFLELKPKEIKQLKAKVGLN